jgi:hypothetical protein
MLRIVFGSLVPVLVTLVFITEVCLDTRSKEFANRQAGAFQSTRWRARAASLWNVRRTLL